MTDFGKKNTRGVKMRTHAYTFLFYPVGTGYWRRVVGGGGQARDGRVGKTGVISSGSVQCATLVTTRFTPGIHRNGTSNRDSNVQHSRSEFTHGTFNPSGMGSPNSRVSQRVPSLPGSLFRLVSE